MLSEGTRSTSATSTLAISWCTKPQMVDILGPQRLRLIIDSRCYWRAHTGTVPFMAIELLTQEAIEGKVKHMYRHDAESFIWVLTWVCLHYRVG
jgi:hypothetical protein